MRRKKILLVAAVLYAAIVAIVWNAATRRARSQTESMLDYAMLDLDATLNGSIDTMLMHAGDSIVEQLGRPAPISPIDMAVIARQRDLDEVNVVARNGEILASNESRLVGETMADHEKSAEFLVLTNGVRHALSHHFRRGAHNNDVRRKYVGVAFPGGSGFVQVGIDETRVVRMFPSIMGFIFDKWLLGETGFFLCADMGDGHLISNPARHFNEATNIDETGYDPGLDGVVEDGKTTFRIRLFGEVCDCRAVVFCGHRIVAALPPAEYYTTRTVYVACVAVALAIVLSLFVALLWRIDADAARLKAFYAAEEEKRAAELEVGRKIQESALPLEPPVSSHYDIFAVMQAAREVGGDFYDYFPLGRSHLAFLVADVSGKGVSAALYMMTAKAQLKEALLADPTFDPAAAVKRTNDELCRNNQAGMFLTAWVGVLDLDTGRVVFANAGHNPPLRLLPGNNPEWIRERSGCPLACFEGATWKNRSLTLSEGETLLLYTDGVTEAANAANELFGEERLASALKAATAGQTEETDGIDHRSEPLALCVAVRAAVASFAAGAAQADDITLMALRFASRADRAAKTFPCDSTALGDTAEFLEQELDRRQCPAKAKTQLMVGLDEIVSNIVRCSGASGIALDLEFSSDPGQVVMEVSDDGVAFNPLSVKEPDITLAPEKRAVGGLGIMLLRKTMDSVSWRRATGHNVLTVVKSFG